MPQTDGKWACIDNVRAHLHFPCSMLETKCEPQVIKFSLSPQGGCQCDHPWPSYDTAIWSLSRHMVCTIRQFSGIQTPLLFGHATSAKSTFDQQNPTFLETTLFPRYLVLRQTLLLAYCSIIHLNRKYVLHYVHSCFCFFAYQSIQKQTKNM